MSKVHRTTISIPADLKEQMDAVTDKVNWSGVAAAAFRAKLFEIQSRGRSSVSKQDVVNRLKALKEQEKAEEFEDGKAAGRAWAERTATPKELERLVTFRQNCEQRDSHDWWDTSSDYFVATDQFA